MNTIFSWYLQNAAITFLLLPMVVLACRAFRDRPAVQNALWLILLLKLLLPPMLFWPWQLDQLWQFTLNYFSSPQVTIAVKAPVTWSEPATEAITWPLQMILLAFWLVGAVGFAGWQIRKIRRQSQWLKQAPAAAPALRTAVGDIARVWKLAPLPVYLVRGIASPFLWCLGRLKLIWPQHLLVHECSFAIIAHELAHVRRRDHWIAWLEMIAAVIWWWNPVYWIIRRNLHATAEMACDAMALAAFPEGRCAYAETLLELSAVSKSGVPALVLGVSTGTPSSFERRMSMIVSEHVSGKLSWRGICVAVLLGVMALPGWGFGQKPQSEGQDDPLELWVEWKGAQTGAEAQQKKQAEADHLLAVIHKLALAAHQGDEEAARKLAQIHSKLQSTFKEAAIGHTAAANAVTAGDLAKMAENIKRKSGEKSAQNADELTRELHLKWLGMAHEHLQHAAKAGNASAPSHNKVYQELAGAAPQGDPEAAKKWTRMYAEALKKMQVEDAAAKQQKASQAYEWKRTEGASNDKKFEGVWLKLADDSRHGTDAEIKKIQEEIKRLEYLKKKLEADKK